jgi:hypothetical protein
MNDGKRLEIAPYLEKLEAIVDPSHVARTRTLQRRAFAFQPVEHIPTVIHYPLSEEEWPDFDFEEIFHDVAKMFLHQLRDVYVGAKLQDDRLYGIRANYGTGIIASLFGCPTMTFRDSLPIALAVPHDELAHILENGVPDLQSGLVGRALDTVAYYREMLAPYPRLQQVVGSQLLDIQGPFDNASIIWGSGIFAAIYDQPQQVIRLMEVVTQTIMAVIEAHRRVDHCSLEEHDGQWNYLGGVCVRNDSSINLSPRHYREFVRPFDARLIQPWGGWIHFCGRAHWWPALLEIPNLRGINPYQGEFYDLYTMYEQCEAAGVAIVQWTTPVDPRCRERIRTGFSRLIWVESYEAALRAKEHLYRTGHVDGFAG